MESFDVVKERQFEIRLPFMGFYETLASYEAERNALSMYALEHELGDAEYWGDDEENKFNDWCTDHYKDYELEVASAYAHNLRDEIKAATGVDLYIFPETLVIDSPREYNFTTDRLFIKVDKKALIELYNKVDKTILEKTIKDNFTSYDGFISHYDNSLKDWGEPETWDHNQWCTLIGAVMAQYDINEYELFDL